jgi:hypothetical protein
MEDFAGLVADLITEDPDIFTDPRDTWQTMVKGKGTSGEVGWATPVDDEGPEEPDKVVQGQKHNVDVPFETDKENIIYHTHPVTGDGPSPLRALPSPADLQVALKDGVTGIGVYNDYYLAKVIPTHAHSLGETGHYEQALKEGNFEEAVKALANLGFSVEIIDSRDNKTEANLDAQ